VKALGKGPYEKGMHMHSNKLRGGTKPLLNKATARAPAGTGSAPRAAQEWPLNLQRGLQQPTHARACSLTAGCPTRRAPRPGRPLRSAKARAAAAAADASVGRSR
jgi:hypothetical protein